MLCDLGGDWAIKSFAEQIKKNEMDGKSNANEGSKKRVQTVVLKTPVCGPYPRYIISLQNLAAVIYPESV